MDVDTNEVGLSISDFYVSVHMGQINPLMSGYKSRIGLDARLIMFTMLKFLCLCRCSMISSEGINVS
jgi:hypothetical protein